MSTIFSRLINFGGNVIGTVPAANLPAITQTTAGVDTNAAQRLGTNTNDAASAGNIGEIISATRLKSLATGVTTGVGKDVTASPIVLTAGDWQISGAVGFQPDTTTSVTAIYWSVSKTANTLSADGTTCVPTSGELRMAWLQPAEVPTDVFTFVIPPYEMNVANATTVTLHLVVNTSFTVSTLAVFGTLVGRRIR